jgi:pilus assembly protein CpaE
MRSGGSLDAEKLDDFLITHHSGARVLLAPVRPEHAGAVSPEFFRAVERVLREMHEFVVIDTPPAFTPEVITAIDASSDVLMVANLDSLALKNTKLGLETLERMEYDRRRVRLVLNRANTDVGINREDLMGILGSDVDARVPSHRDITRSVNRGEPIALNGRSEAAKVFHQLARLYLDQVSSANGHARTSPRRRSVLLRRGR